MLVLAGDCSDSAQPHSKASMKAAQYLIWTMLHITTLHYLVLGAALFLLGVIGVLTRRNVVIVLMSIELILNAVNLNLVAFSRYEGIHGPGALHGQVFAIFVITDAAAEAAVGLGILIAFFRNKETVNIDEVNLLKW